MRVVDAATEINASASAIWHAITKIDQVRAWWGADTGVITATRNALWLLLWRGASAREFGYLASGVIATCTPLERFEIADYVYLNPERPVFDHMRLLFEIKSLTDAKSVLRVTQSGYPSGEHWDWYYGAVKSAWPTVVQSVKVYVENQASLDTST